MPAIATLLWATESNLNSCTLCPVMQWGDMQIQTLSTIHVKAPLWWCIKWNTATHSIKSVQTVCLSTVSQDSPTDAFVRCFELLFEAPGCSNTPTLGATPVAPWASTTVIAAEIMYADLHTSLPNTSNLPLKSLMKCGLMYWNAVFFFFLTSDSCTHCTYTTEVCLSATKPIAHTECCQKFANTYLRHLLIHIIGQSVVDIWYARRLTHQSGSGVKLCMSTWSAVDVSVHKKLCKTTCS